MLNLRDYQQHALSDTQQSFRAHHKRPLVCLPCGAGKTVLFAYMADGAQRKGNTVWFLVHRRELMDQTVKTFERFSIPLNTIHVGMVATIANHPERWPRPDLIIFDEAHFSAANTWLKIINHYPDAYIVGLTATPCRLDGKPLGAIYDDLIVGISATELIRQGYLSQYKYYAPSVADLSGLKRKGGDYDQTQAADTLMQRAVYGDVIKSWREFADGLQTICYCTTIQHSQNMAEEFQSAGINAVHFDGNTPDRERADIIGRFRAGEIKILCNVDLISVGFDVPDCWCCLLLRPTMSTALHIQQSMRALRPQKDKTAIIIDAVGNYQRHGLPDDAREWSLTDTIRPVKQYGEDGKLLISQCSQCYYTFKSGPPVCPQCGAKIGLTREEIKNIKEIRLEEVKQGYRAKAAEAVKDKTAEECKTLMELQAYAKKKNYKPGWAYLQAKKRGLK